MKTFTRQAAISPTGARRVTVSALGLTLALLSAARAQEGELNVSGFSIGDEIASVRIDRFRDLYPDVTLNVSEGSLDPQQFFRLNRAYLVHHEAIQDIIHYTNSRLKTVLQPTAPEGDVLVSRERVNAFRQWLDR